MVVNVKLRSCANRLNRQISAAGILWIPVAVASYVASQRFVSPDVAATVALASLGVLILRGGIRAFQAPLSVEGMQIRIVGQWRTRRVPRGEIVGYAEVRPAFLGRDRGLVLALRLHSPKGAIVRLDGEKPSAALASLKILGISKVQ